MALFQKVEHEHPSNWHYRYAKCRCDGCRKIASARRLAYYRARPEGSRRKQYYPKPLDPNVLDYLRRLVAYDPNRDYDSEEMMDSD